MTDNKQNVKDLIAVCNEFIDSKILFADRKIQNILESIAQNADVYNLIGDCLAVFNREKEFDKAFTVSSTGKGYFAMPKEEAKIIALVFCVLADINSAKISFDEVVGKYFVNEEGKKDYHMFMQKVMIPFRDLIAEAFGVSSNITTVEAIEEMKDGQEEDICFEETKEDEPKEKVLGKERFCFKDTENLDRTFELAKGIAVQIYELLEEERKQTEELKDSFLILNSIVIACDKKDFEMLNGLVLGVKYTLKTVKNVRFLTKELADVVQSQLYCD